MRYRLSTLLILLAVVPPLIAWAWSARDRVMTLLDFEPRLAAVVIAACVGTAYLLSLAAAWTVDLTVALTTKRPK